MPAIRLRDIMELWDAPSAMHAIDVWAHNVESYNDIADMIGVADTRELLKEGHDFNRDKPEQCVIKRAVGLLTGRWRWRQMRRVASDLLDEYREQFMDRCRALKLPHTAQDAAFFLQMLVVKTGEFYPAMSNGLRQPMTPPACRRTGGGKLVVSGENE